MSDEIDDELGEYARRLLDIRDDIEKLEKDIESELLRRGFDKFDEEAPEEDER